MVETIVTIPQGRVLPGLAVGAVTGVVIGKLGGMGVVCAAPTLLLIAFCCATELWERRLPSALIAFGTACAGVLWRLC
jgi:hypothetical protein